MKDLSVLFIFLNFVIVAIWLYFLFPPSNHTPPTAHCEHQELFTDKEQQTILFARGLIQALPMKNTTNLNNQEVSLASKMRQCNFH